MPLIPPQDLTNRTAHQQERRRYFLICMSIVVLCLALKLPTMFFQRLENDERIYWALSKNWLETGSYSLRGSDILAELPPHAYDRPLFHHPPLFAVLLLPFVAADILGAAILISWLGHVSAVIGVGLICWSWRRRSWQGTHLLLWLPVLGVALDPVLTFCSRKLWLDDLVGGLAGLAMGLLCLAADRRRVAWAAAGGTALGLAALTKLPALTLIPAAALLLWLAPAISKPQRRRLLAAAGLPVLLLVTPWFILFYSHYRSFLPEWVRPDAAMIESSALVSRAVSQPWHYYITESSMVAPVVLVVLLGYLARRRHLWSLRLGMPIIWVMTVVGVLTVLGLRGQGLQLRFLTIASPGLYAALAAVLGRCDPRRSVIAIVALLAILYGAIYAGYFLLNPVPDEIQPVPQFIWQRWWAFR